MSKFKLKEADLTIDDQVVKVRALTQRERVEVIKTMVAEDKKMDGPILLASLGLIEPKLTVKELEEEPAEAVELIANKVMELSGMLKKEKPEKQT